MHRLGGDAQQGAIMQRAMGQPNRSHRRALTPLGLTLTAILTLGAMTVAPTSSAVAGAFKTHRPVRAVVLGGSISMYYKGNYGEFLQHGCKNLEVINRAKVGAGGPALVKRLEQEILGNKALMGELGAAKERWMLFQGGLNSVWSPWLTNATLANLFAKANAGGLQTFALSLTPWGDERDGRFAGWKGVWTHRATQKVNKFLLGGATPDAALGRYGKDHGHEWMKGELPNIAVDLWEIGLQDSKATLRPTEPLSQTFARSRYKKEVEKKDAWVAEARAVPRHYLAKQYRDFDHIHPNSDGHRLMAVAACKKAPASWGCDCGRIERAIFKGSVMDPK